MNGTRIRYALATLGLGMVLASGQAAAVPTFIPGTTFEDDDVDFVVGDGDGVLEVGERLIGVLEINTIFGSQPGQGPVQLVTTGEELTGVFDTTILSKTPTLTPGEFDFVFGPTAGGTFGNADTDGGATPGAGTGVMVRFWSSDFTPDLNLFGATSCASQADCFAQAGLGGAFGAAFFMDLGFSGDPDEGWRALGAADSTATVLGGGPGSIFGEFNNVLTVLADSGQGFASNVPCGIFCGPGGDGLAGWVGSGTIGGGNQLGGGIVSEGAFATSDFQGSTASVPAPGSVALLAVGLFGLGFALRMRGGKV